MIRWGFVSVCFSSGGQENDLGLDGYICGHKLLLCFRLLLPRILAFNTSLSMVTVHLFPCNFCHNMIKTYILIGMAFSVKDKGPSFLKKDIKK